MLATSPLSVFHGDCRDLLKQLPAVGQQSVHPEATLIFGDPPDNLGLNYGDYADKIPGPHYYGWMDCLIRDSLRKTCCFWLSYYYEHDLEIKNSVFNLRRYDRPSLRDKTFIWRYTFGQHNNNDFGSGFRYLLRLHRPGATFNPEAIRIPSIRQYLGDPRANPDGRVPDDVWEYPAIFDEPRIVGNSPQRRKWHPTQHPEELLERIVLMHTNRHDLVVDLFGGTGSMIRVCKKLQRRCVVAELDANYCDRIAEENGVPILKSINS